MPKLSDNEKAKHLRFMAHILILIVNERFNDCISEIKQIDSLEYEIMHQLFLSKLTYLDLIDKLNKLNKKVRILGDCLISKIIYESNYFIL